MPAFPVPAVYAEKSIDSTSLAPPNSSHACGTRIIRYKHWGRGKTRRGVRRVTRTSDPSGAGSSTHLNSTVNIITLSGYGIRQPRHAPKPCRSGEKQVVALGVYNGAGGANVCWSAARHIVPMYEFISRAARKTWWVHRVFRQAGTRHPCCRSSGGVLGARQLGVALFLKHRSCVLQHRSCVLRHKSCVEAPHLDRH